VRRAVENEWRKTMSERDVKPGRLYRHFKGGLYKFLCLATHTETEEEFVVYQEIKSQRAFVRPADNFFGSVDKEGYSGPRFVEVDNNGQEESRGG